MEPTGHCAMTGTQIISKSLLVCLSGKIASGKTTLSTKIAEHFGWSKTSFGDYLRGEAQRNGRTKDRQCLQDLGQRMVEEDAELFCRKVLAAGDFVAGEGFVLDGLRHVVVLDRLVRIVSPAEVRVIYLDAPDPLIWRREEERSDRDHRDSKQAMEHAVEAGLDQIREIADEIIDASLPECVVLECCIDAVHRWVSQRSPKD